MRVNIGTLDIDDELLRAISARSHSGVKRKATRTEARHTMIGLLMADLEHVRADYHQAIEDLEREKNAG